MSVFTYYVVLPFERDEAGNLTPREAKAAANRQVALARAAVLARKLGGAVVFSRSGDPQLGKYSDATVHQRFGDTPQDLSLF